jgi:DNA-binding transcriptional ArsR family regulator
MARVQSDAQMHDTLVALADPKRRAILRCLAQGEARVTELAAPFDVSLNAISKHIKLLERAGLVQRRKIGREHVLRFNPKPLDPRRLSRTWFWGVNCGLPFLRSGNCVNHGEPASIGLKILHAIAPIDEGGHPSAADLRIALSLQPISGAHKIVRIYRL